MALKSKKLNSLMPKGSSPVNSLTSSSTSNTTRTYGRSLTNASGFSRRSQNLRHVKQSTDRSNSLSSNSVAIPVPKSSIFSIELEESPESTDNNDDLTVLDSSDTKTLNTSKINIDMVKSVKKVILVSEGNHEDVISDSSIQITIKDEIVSIRSTEGFLMTIPFEKIKHFKIANKDAFCGVIMFVMLPTQKRIKHIVKRVEIVAVHLTNPLPLKIAAQIAKTLGVSLRKFTLAESTRFSPLAFDPIPAAEFSSNGRSKTALSKITNQMDTDFSSLERRVRRNQTRGKVTYEELNDNEINEIMLGENGNSKIYGYIPDNEQLYFEPILKVKFDNKKTFSITNNEFKCLYNDNWVNDTIIDFVTAHLLHTARENNIPKTQNIEIMNSFFFTTLSRPVEDHNYYKNVKSWFKRVNDLFDKDYIIIPINQDLHWYFVVISGLKQLKRRYLKKKGIMGDSNISIDSNANIDTNTDNIASEDMDAIDDEVINLSDEIQKDSNTQLTGDHVATNKATRKKNKEPIEIDEFNHSNSGDIIPVRSPVKNKRKLIDDETGDLRADNRPPGAAQISVLNSLRKNHDKAIQLLKHFLISYAKDKYNLDINPQDIFKKICLVPQQKNLNDCGIHVLFNIQTMLQNPTEFDRIILKRPTGNKIRNKAKLENEKFFDKNRLLNYREELRDLLFQLLKKQVEASDGDSSTIGTKTVGQKLIEDSSLSASNGPQGTEFDSKISSTNHNINDGNTLDGSDDDLVITHFHEKKPVLENKSNSPKLKERKQKLKISIMGIESDKNNDLDIMASDSDYELQKKSTKQSGRRKLNVRRSKVSDANIASSSSPSPLPESNTIDSYRKTRSSMVIEENTVEKSELQSTLDSDGDAMYDENNTALCAQSTTRISLPKSLRRPKSTEPLSQDSFNGESDGVKLLESDEDDEMIDENQRAPKTSTVDETYTESHGSEISNIQSTNSAELLMQDIDKEISQESDNPETQQSKQEKELQSASGVLRRFRNSTIARITGSKQSIPIEITDDADHHVVEILDTPEESSNSNSISKQVKVKEDNYVGIELLKSVTPESETNDVEDFAENLNFSRTPIVNVDTREPVLPSEISSHNNSKFETEHHIEHPMKVRISSIHIVNDIKPQEKQIKDKLDTEISLPKPDMSMKKENDFSSSSLNLRNEISSYLQVSNNTSPIKLQSESPKKNVDSSRRSLGKELNNNTLPESRKRKLTVESVGIPVPTNEKVFNNTQLVKSSGTSKLNTDKQPAKNLSVPLPLHATRRQSPREDLKPISASLFSKSKSKLKTNVYPTQPVTMSNATVVETQKIKSEPKKAIIDTHKDGKNRERSAASETQHQNHKRNWSEDSYNEGDEAKVTLKKKTRSNYRVSDTELKNSLYKDKYCGNVYSERKSTKKKSKDFHTQDVYTALRSNDDYTVNFTNVPPSYDNDEYIMNKSDTEVVKSDDEDAFNPTEMNRDDSYGHLFNEDLDNSIARRANVSRYSRRKY